MADEKPHFVDNDFLSKALQSYKHDNTIEVSNFTVNSGFSNHFGSSMFQSLIEFSSSRFPKSDLETISVVIKTKPTAEGFTKQIVDAGPLFENEIRMYMEVIPAMMQLYERSGMKVELAPELIFVASEPFEIIILKDMSSEGFSTTRSAPAELEDTKMIIKKLAEYHAASYFLAENNEIDFNSFNFSLYSKPELMKMFYNTNLNIFKEQVESWEGFEQFIPKLEHLIAQFSEIGAECIAANEPGHGFNVLNHGDFHTANILFKMNENKRLERSFFIDYQTSIYCSPAIDVTYMLALVKRDEDGEIPSDDLIMFYHEEFVKALKMMGFMKTPPSLVDLNIELLKHGAVKMFLSVFFVPFSFVDWDKVKPEEMAEDGGKAFTRKLFQLPQCKRLMQKELKSFVHKGWL